MMKTWRGTAWVIGLLLAAGCGGAAPRAYPASPVQPGNEGVEAKEEAAPPPGEAPRSSGYAGEAAGAQGAYPPSAAATQPMPTVPRYAAPPAPSAAPWGGATADEREQGLLDDFLVAEAALMSSGPACGDACRALRSMQRATVRLCAMASDNEEQERCRNAETRYRSARERVRSLCGQCQEGPSLDPKAPLGDGG